MTVKINADDLVDGLEGNKKELSRDLAREWFSDSQEALIDRGDDAEYEVYPVVQSASPPSWDEGEEAWVFSYNHIAAPFFEFGTEPHDIEAKEAEFLAFEWPDAPPEIREQFEDTFPTVFFKKVHHPGTPALRYLQSTKPR